MKFQKSIDIDSFVYVSVTRLDPLLSKLLMRLHPKKIKISKLGDSNMIDYKLFVFSNREIVAFALISLYVLIHSYIQQKI